MTFREAIAEVLRTSKRPMSTRQVSDAVVASGKVSTNGKTPDATIGALLYKMAHSPDNPGVRRLAVEGETRAMRGSVRWVWDPKVTGQAFPLK